MRALRRSLLVVQRSKIPRRRPCGPHSVVPYGHTGGARIARGGLEVGDDATAGIHEPGVNDGRHRVVAHRVAGAAVGDAAAEVTQIVLRPRIDTGSGEAASGERGTRPSVAGVVVHLYELRNGLDAAPGDLYALTTTGHALIEHIVAHGLIHRGD